VVVDRAGIGQMLATGLRKRFGSRVLAYHADSSSVDADLTELYGLLYNGKVRLFRNDMSADYTEAVRQLKAARRIVRGGKLKVARERSTDRIDFAKALTYLPRALNRRLSPDTATGGEQRAHAATQPRSRDLLSGW
jgi:hypothetical protein